MEWITFFKYLIIAYVAYYAINLLFDVMKRGGAKKIKDDKTYSLSDFDDEVEPTIVNSDLDLKKKIVGEQ